MADRYSPTTRGFYLSSHDRAMPPDVIPVSPEEYEAAHVAQSRGLEIVVVDGKLSSQPRNPSPVTSLPMAAFLARLTDDEQHAIASSPRGVLWLVKTASVTLADAVPVLEASGMDASRIKQVTAAE